MSDVVEYFKRRIVSTERRERPFAETRMRVGLALENAVYVPERSAVIIVALARTLLSAGCDVVIPSTGSLLASPTFANGLMSVASIEKVSVAFAAQDDKVSWD